MERTPHLTVLRDRSRLELARPTAQPCPASHSHTDSDRQSLHTNCTCHACAAAGRARCWHWLACDVQVHNTLTQTVVRIIARMREARFDGPVLKLFLPSLLPKRARRNDPRDGGGQGQTRRGAEGAQRKLPYPRRTTIRRPTELRALNICRPDLVSQTARELFARRDASPASDWQDSHVSDVLVYRGSVSVLLVADRWCLG